MPMPDQAPPIARGELVVPSTFIRPVDPSNIEQRDAAARLLLFNANYNDPAPYDVPSYARMLVSALPGAGTPGR